MENKYGYNLCYIEKDIKENIDILQQTLMD